MELRDSLFFLAQETATAKLSVHFKFYLYCK